MTALLVPSLKMQRQKQVSLMYVFGGCLVFNFFYKSTSIWCFKHYVTTPTLPCSRTASNLSAATVLKAMIYLFNWCAISYRSPENCCNEKNKSYCHNANILICWRNSVTPLHTTGVTSMAESESSVVTSVGSKKGSNFSRVEEIWFQRSDV